MDYCATRKGSNDPTEKEVNDSFTFRDKGGFNERKGPIDISCIIGYDSSENDRGSVILMRFHKLAHKMNLCTVQIVL